MRKLTLARVLRGSTKRAVEEIAELVGAPFSVQDAEGKVLLGDRAAVGERYPITTLGAVVGPPPAERLAKLLAHLAEREEEKLALADETLGRYKELTLLYDISDKLSRVLDVDEVCELVVEEAARFLGASSVSILLLDRRREILDPIACSNPSARTHRMAATAGIEGRVLRTGRAEFVEDLTTTSELREPGVAALMVAPLRSGETVFGLLRAANNEVAAWTAGHLKLVTSLAGNAAAAISHALLHRERLRQQALRHQIERFASPWALNAAFGERARDQRRAVATVLCDVGDVARFVATGEDPEELMAIMRRATMAALAALMAEGATAQLSHSELIVGLFTSADGPDSAARAAVRAATAIVRRLERELGGVASPGLAITHTELPDGDPTEAFFAAIGSAANLQRGAEGRILVDESIAAVLADSLHTVVEHTSVHGKVYEVRA